MTALLAHFKSQTQDLITILKKKTSLHIIISTKNMYRDVAINEIVNLKIVVIFTEWVDQSFCNLQFKYKGWYY